MFVLLLILGTLPTFSSANCNELFDATQPINSSQFQCLGQQNHTLFMARVGTSDGQADQVGIQNIINSGWGWNGWVYLDPCTNTTGCPSPAEHVQRVNYSLNLAQPQELNKTNYGMFPNAFFINIQGQWSSNRMVNQQILTEYVQAAAATFEGTSFITDYTTWSTNFGPYWTVPASAGDASGVPFIWWRKYDGRTDTNGFSPFGNFTMVLLKQYAQNVNVCSVKINLNAGFCVGPFPKNCTCNDFTNE